MFNRFAIAAAIAVSLAACGGGGGGANTANTGGGNTGPSGGNSAYTVSVESGTFGTLPVTVSADAVTVANRTITLDSASQVGNRAGQYRAFDSAGATSGQAMETHYFGENAGYSHLRFGSWARGVVNPGTGFRIGEQFGAFLAPNTGSTPTPTANLPVAGLVATWLGHYAGYVDKRSVGVSQVVGQAQIEAVFGQTQFGDGGMIIQFAPPDPSRSSFAVPPTGLVGYQDRVWMNGVITGSTFENEIGATYTIFGQTLPRPDSISLTNAGCVNPGDCLYSPGVANSGGMQGGFFGADGGEAGGTYHFTIGTTKAAGSFGGTLQ